MTFIYPAFLWAAALVAVPIIIHLFNFQRPKKVLFTNIEFLREVKAVSNSRNRLKNLLVLLARCGFIVALAVAFAQPQLRKNAQPTSGPANSNYVSLYVDNSFSMQNEQDGKRLLDAASDLAGQALRAFPANAQFSLMNNSFEADQNYFVEASKAAEHLARLDFSNAGRPLADVYTRQLATLQANTSERRNHLFYISDFQKNSTGDLSRLDLDSTNNFYLLPLAPSEVGNLYVDSVWLDNPFVRVNENNVLHVKIAHSGPAGVSDKVVKLFIDDKQVSGGTVSIAPGASETLALNFAVGSPGAKACRLNLDDYPVVFDNDYYFTLTVAPEIRVVHINAENNQFVPNVYGNEPFFVVEKFSATAVDYNKLNTANLVVLQGLRDLDPGLQTALRNLLAKGGSVLLFPPGQPNAASYADLLGFKFNLLPDVSPEERLDLAVPDGNNPFFGGVFEKVAQNMDLPRAAPVIAWSGGQRLLAFRNDQPFISAFPVLNGQAYLCAAPLTEQFSNFAQHALFVPVMYKIALSSRRRAERLAYSFAEKLIAVPLNEGLTYGRNDIFKLVRPDSANDQQAPAELIPAQRLADNTLVLELPKTNLAAGNYQLARRSDGQTVGHLALNYDPTESRFDAYTAAELRTIFAGRKNVQVFENVEADRFAAEFGAKNIAQPLWRWFLLAALAFFLAEVLLLRFWKG